MKKFTTTTFAILLLSVSLASCTQSTSTANKKSTSTSNGSTSGDGATTPVDPTGTDSINGCNGVPRTGATSCYYTNLPRLVFNGLPNKITYGPTIWSSKTRADGGNLPDIISPNQFKTDASFAVRMKPSYPLGGELSAQGKTCGPYLISNFSKIKVYVMLRRKNDTIGEVKELIAGIDTYSNTARFTVPSGTVDPYILEVIGLASNHRCQASVYGALSPTQAAACTAGSLYLDIPLRLPTASVPNPVTECVAFKLEMATDSTYDFPN